MGPMAGRRESSVFVDTSAFLALLARNDQYHRQAGEIFRRLLRERVPQFTTNIVVIEAHALILSTLGAGTGVSAGSWHRWHNRDPEPSQR